MKLKYITLVVVAITAIVMIPVSKMTGMSYPALLLASLMLESAGTIVIAAETI